MLFVVFLVVFFVVFFAAFNVIFAIVLSPSSSRSHSYYLGLYLYETRSTRIIKKRRDYTYPTASLIEIDLIMDAQRSLQLPSVAMVFPAPVWSAFPQEQKVQILQASAAAQGKRVQAIVDTTSGNRIILGSVIDILNHDVRFRVEACILSGSPTLALFLEHTNFGYPAPNSNNRLVHDVSPFSRIPGISAELQQEGIPSPHTTPSMEYSSPVIPQLSQIEAPPGPSSNVSRSSIPGYNRASAEVISSSNSGTYSNIPTNNGTCNVVAVSGRNMGVGVEPDGRGPPVG
ncbi:hypothetical protein F4819DRAFT_482895 [Hypoxylon fuscum]|nr:hypothetical protein F4819DRAFT_482895 [Hypoxylon fuscum]